MSNHKIGKEHEKSIDVLKAESFMADVPAVSAREVNKPVQNIASNTPMEVISCVEFFFMGARRITQWTLYQAEYTATEVVF